jgi:hypothetical protein
MRSVLEVVSAQPLVAGEEFSAERLMHLANQAAVNEYLASARRLGMFRGAPGRDLLSRLRSADPHAHRGAMAECTVAWWLGDVLRLNLQPRPSGAGKSVLEYSISHGSHRIGVEVKAPFRPMRYVPGQVYTADPNATDHIGAVMKCLGNAHHQFDPASMNLVVLVPSLDWGILSAVIRCLEEETALAIDAVMIVDYLHDFVNPTRAVPGSAFLHYRCSVVRNRRRNPPPDSMWRGWPVYEGPDYEFWKTLKPVSGKVKKRWVRTPGVHFEGRVIVPA